jgi:hypothetical protein
VRDTIQEQGRISSLTLRPEQDIKPQAVQANSQISARAKGVVNFRRGEHGRRAALLPEKGMVIPGDLVIGATATLHVRALARARRAWDDRYPPAMARQGLAKFLASVLT